MKDLLADLISGDDARAEKAITPLVELGHIAIQPLLDLTRSENADIRWWAVRALAASPHTQMCDLLLHLNDSAPEVRAATALAILNHPHADAIEALIHALDDTDALVATLASNALAKIGSPSTPSLLQVMQEAKTSVRILAMRALAEIKDHRAIPIMMQCLNNENESTVIQYWAQQGLEKLGLDMVYIKP